MTFADTYNLRQQNGANLNAIANAVDGAVKVHWGGTTTGTSTAYACAMTPTWTSTIRSEVRFFIIIPHTTNTGAATLAVDSLTAAAFRQFNAALSGGELKQSCPTLIAWDGTYYHVVSPTALPPLFLSGGSVGIGTSSPTSKLHLLSAGADCRLTIESTGGDSFDQGVLFKDTSSTWHVGNRYSSDANGFGIGRTNSKDDLQINSSGFIFASGAKNDTTASGANCVLNSADGRLQRSTSSARYKKDIERIDEGRAARVLDLEEVWYRSTAKGDRGDWSYYGLLAEQVAQVDPRLVYWSYPEDAFETVEHTLAYEAEEETDILDAAGEKVRRKVTKTRIRTERRLKEGAIPTVPESVFYDRIGVLLLPVVRKQRDRIAALEARIEKLESKAGK